ncbi:unnamed protein product [Closterium sp. NIES-54]
MAWEISSSQNGTSGTCGANLELSLGLTSGSGDRNFLAASPGANPAAVRAKPVNTEETHSVYRLPNLFSGHSDRSHDGESQAAPNPAPLTPASLPSPSSPEQMLPGAPAAFITTTSLQSCPTHPQPQAQPQPQAAQAAVQALNEEQKRQLLWLLQQHHQKLVQVQQHKQQLQDQLSAPLLTASNRRSQHAELEAHACDQNEPCRESDLMASAAKTASVVPAAALAATIQSQISHNVSNCIDGSTRVDAVSLLARLWSAPPAANASNSANFATPPAAGNAPLPLTAGLLRRSSLAPAAGFATAAEAAASATPSRSFPRDFSAPSPAARGASASSALAAMAHGASADQGLGGSGGAGGAGLAGMARRLAELLSARAEGSVFADADGMAAATTAAAAAAAAGGGAADVWQPRSGFELPAVATEGSFMAASPISPAKEALSPRGLDLRPLAGKYLSQVRADVDLERRPDVEAAEGMGEVGEGGGDEVAGGGEGDDGGASEGGSGGGNSNDNGDGDGGDGNKRKMRLSQDQISMLEQVFQKHPKLVARQKATLAERLGVRVRQVEVWFQNRRARTKVKQTEAELEGLRRRCQLLAEENKRLKLQLAARERGERGERGEKGEREMEKEAKRGRGEGDAGGAMKRVKVEGAFEWEVCGSCKRNKKQGGEQGAKQGEEAAVQQAVASNEDDSSAERQMRMFL